MLENLHIQNFRLFRDFKIENLARVNLIVGKNNVGKSSLLEALHLLINQKVPAAALDFLEARDNIAARAPSPGAANYEILDLFYGYQPAGESLIHLNATGSSPLSLIIEKNNGQLKLLYDYSERDEGQITFRLVDNRIESSSLRNRTTPLPKSHYITTKGFNYRFLSQLWDQTVLSPKENEVITMLQILEPRLERINFPSSQISTAGIRVKLTDQQQPVPLTSMGDGLHRILTLAIILVDSENGYLLVDEIDTGLHYRAITDMWQVVMETAVRLNVQVFATTHSWDCIRSFAEALDMQTNKNIGKLFRLERRGADIVAVDYTAADMAVVISQNVQNLEVR